MHSHATSARPDSALLANTMLSFKRPIRPSGQAWLAQMVQMPIGTKHYAATEMFSSRIWPR
jgi:hypothetical protein